jgi:DNA-3-methyladenine glycosylase II
MKHCARAAAQTAPANEVKRMRPDWTKGEEFLKKTDARFTPLIEKYGHCTLAPLPLEKYFSLLMRAVLSQGIGLGMALGLAAKVAQRFGDSVQPQDILATGPGPLLKEGVIPQKAWYIYHIAQAASEGRLTLEKYPEMDDWAIVKQMEAVKGLGRWTAEQFLILAMARPDVFPGKDQFLQAALKEFYGLEKKPKNRLEENPLISPWQPWRSVAVWYLWQMFGEKKEKEYAAYLAKKDSGPGPQR